MWQVYGNVISKLRIRAEKPLDRALLPSSMSALKVLSNFCTIFICVVINLSVLLCKFGYTYFMNLWMQN